MSRGILICITGIDGSGKTTLAKNLNISLKKDGFDSTYIYGRVFPVLSRMLMIAGRKIVKMDSKDIFVDYDKYNKNKEKIFQNRFVSDVYRLSFLIDQSMLILVKILPSILYGKIVVCDRYIYDTIITDLSVDLGYSDTKILSLTKKMFQILPEPDVIFIVDVPEEIAYSRKNDIPHLNYLKDRRMKYLSMGKSLGAIVLDGSKNMSEVLNETKKRLVPVLSR